MKLTADLVQENGGFTGQPVKREIIWKGETYDVYVRRLSYKSAVDDAKAYKDGAPAIIAHRIANCIVDENGVPIFTIEHVTGLHEDGSPVMIKDKDGNNVERGPLDNSLTSQLLVLIGEVNDLGKSKATVD